LYYYCKKNGRKLVAIRRIVASAIIARIRFFGLKILLNNRFTFFTLLFYKIFNQYARMLHATMDLWHISRAGGAYSNQEEDVPLVYFLGYLNKHFFFMELSH